jgi:hypothetical protein
MYLECRSSEKSLLNLLSTHVLIFPSEPLLDCETEEEAYTGAPEGEYEVVYEGQTCPEVSKEWTMGL